MSDEKGDKLLDANTSGSDETPLEYETNTDSGFSPDKLPKQWEKNFARRWANKNVTKKEMMESLADVKLSTSVISNNLGSLNARLATVESTLQELIAYVNRNIG